MQTTVTKRKTLISLAVSALVLALALVLAFSIRGKADESENEIANFAYQTIKNDSLESQETSLRFLFTVDDLDYTRVGFVFSKTNSNPTDGGEGCRTYGTSSVYSAVRADGELVPAPTGHTDGRSAILL